MSTRLLLVCLLLLAPRPARSQTASADATSAPRLFRVNARTPQGLQDLFHYAGESLPLVSAHRGGPAPGFPENCLATFEHTLKKSFAMLEVDPRYARDGAIVLHHDATLDRTTTGKGRLSDFTLEELKQLRLKDPAGNVIGFTLPTLDEALEWARGKTILVLDQKDVPVVARVRKIEEHRAEAFTMLIVYSYRDARKCYELNPNVMMEVMVPDRGKLGEFDELDVPWRNVIAFVGHNPPEDRGLYEAVHARGARCMIGTSRNLDRRFLSGAAGAIETLEPHYRAFLKRGADLIETDIPAHLGPALYGEATVPPAKTKYFARTQR